MSRSGLCEGEFDCREDILAYGRWRAATKKALNGKKGQAFLKELKSALEEMPVKKLVSERLMDYDGSVCAIGQALQHRGIGTGFDVSDYEAIAGALGINAKIVQEIEWENDKNCGYERVFFVDSNGKTNYRFEQSDFARHRGMIEWLEAHINEE